MSWPMETVTIHSLIEAHERLLSVRTELDSAITTLNGIRTQIERRLSPSQNPGVSSCGNILNQRDSLNYSASSRCKRWEKQTPNDSTPEDRVNPLRGLNPLEKICFEPSKQDDEVETIVQQKENERYHDIKRAVELITKSESSIRYANVLYQRRLILEHAKDVIAEDLKKCRRRLIEQLGRIFPIKLTDECHTIRGFDIPSPQEFVSRLETMSTSDFWMIGTALGFAAHFTHLLARYLDIPLSRQIGLFSSRTVLRSPSTIAALANLPMMLSAYSSRVARDHSTQLDSNVTTLSRKTELSDSNMGLLSLFNVLQYAKMNDNSESDIVPTLDLTDTEAFPFPITTIHLCLRCRPESTSSQTFSHYLTPRTSEKPYRTIISPDGLLWVETLNSTQSPRSCYYNAIRLSQPPAWAAHLILKSANRVKTPNFPSPILPDPPLQSESSTSEDLQFIQTPRGPRQLQPLQTVPFQRSNFPPKTPPHINTSTASPFPQSMPGGPTSSSSTSTSYDPISLTLSILGLGGGNSTTNSRSGPMDEIDATEMPLFVKANTIIDRQKFIIGLREFNNLLRNLEYAYNERHIFQSKGLKTNDVDDFEALEREKVCGTTRSSSTESRNLLFPVIQILKKEKHDHDSTSQGTSLEQCDSFVGQRPIIVKES